MNLSYQITEFHILWGILSIVGGIDIFRENEKGINNTIATITIIALLNFWIKEALCAISFFGGLLIIQSVLKSISFKKPLGFFKYLKYNFDYIVEKKPIIKWVLRTTIINILLFLIFQKEDLAAFYQKRNYLTHNYIYISIDNERTLKRVKSTIEVEDWSPYLKEVYFNYKQSPVLIDSYDISIENKIFKEFETVSGETFLAKYSTETWN